MNEGLEVWIPREPVPSVHSLDTQPIRPLIESRSRDIPLVQPQAVAKSGRVHHVSMSYMIGYSREPATIRCGKSDLLLGGNIQSGVG